MIPVDEALHRILSGLSPLGTVEQELHDSLGRVLAEPAHATLDLPRFDQSAVDGYAVRQQDITDAPCWLPVADTVSAEAREQGAPLLHDGTATRIFTGGWLPQNADTVVRQELTERDGDRVRILQRLEPATDIRRQGDELREHDAVGRGGQRITPGLLGAIAMAGVSRVRQFKAPRIAVLVTGDEVAPIGTPMALGQVPDANGPLLRAYLRSWGYDQVSVAYLNDRFDTVRQTLDRALGEADVVITTGGVSVGDHDHIPGAAKACGAETLLWKVAQKPGMPLFVARRGGAMLYGLPGNPASVLVNLLVYVRPALQKLEGLEPQAWQTGVAAAPIRAETEKTFWLRTRLGHDDSGRTLLQPLGKQASHMLSNLAEAQALVRVPPSREPWPAGTLLQWIPLA